MSHLVCPLCGKNAPLSTFDPESLELDIVLVEFRGLGRGRGFKVSGRHSVLGDDDITPKVADRVVELCEFLLGKGILGSAYLSGRLGLGGAKDDDVGTHALEKENASLRTQLSMASQKGVEPNSLYRNLLLSYEGLRRENAAVVGENGRLREENRTLASNNAALAKELDEKESELANTEDELQGMVDAIEDYTDYEHDPSEENQMGFIKDTLHKILEDLEALKAESEE